MTATSREAPPLRRHQRLALEALGSAWDRGRRRAWVELPPGSGKTRVGLETARRLLDDGTVERVVVLGPNTAIQAQWLAQARAFGLDAGTDRALGRPLTALTYQSVAVFDPEAEDPDEDDGAELGRLHENGRALVERLREAGDILLLLDECHHLLEVWGRLLGELLELLPRAHVLGLTATPPATMTRAQARLVHELFGDVVFEASIPAVVREGDLAPFAELAWLVRPTAAESQWLDAGAERFRELTTQLTDPTYGDGGFLAWLDARFCAPGVPWRQLMLDSPELTDAALRMHHAGLLDLPGDARPDERHRHPPTADDWVALLEDWLLEHVAASDREEDARLLEAVRRTLPALGYVWTRRGIRAGRSTVDRVLARSAAKTTATVEVVAAEALTLGDRLRMVVLCDHERASATLPVDLEGVLDRTSGSAHRVLAALLADPATATLGPLLVTGRTVAGAPSTVEALRDAVARTDPELARTLTTEEVGDGVHALVGGWTSRVWVRHVTRFFEAGRCRVLVGTRALLGEGWDARRVTGLVDLTAVTTSTAVVQTRGRALRTDPTWPEKVALTWTVVCVAPDHPRGDNDWRRLVRKHDGFYGVDDEGAVVDGVAHLDPAFSPYEPPDPSRFEAVNARMLARSGRRDEIRARWRVGEPYVDEVAHDLRLRPARPGTLGDDVAPPAVVALADRLEVRELPPPALGTARGLTVAAGVLGALAVLLLVLGAPAWAAGCGFSGAAAWVAGRRTRLRALHAHGERVLAAAAEPPSVHRLARAVADGLHAADLLPVGAAGVSVDIGADGVYRCLLRGVTEAESALFAGALEEAVSPLLSPRYVVPRWTVLPPPAAPERALAAARGEVPADGLVWHAVPAVAGRRAALARRYAEGWRRWVGGGDAVATSSPEGAGALASQRGADPLRLTTVVRKQWL